MFLFYCQQILQEHKGEFDVVITDSSDPVGPATKLFSNTYYSLIREALTEKGVLSSQGSFFSILIELTCDRITFFVSLFIG